MQLVIFGFFGIIILVLFIFSESGGKKILGVFASLLMLMLGVWCISDPISYESGNVLKGTNIQNTTATINGNSTITSSVLSLNETTNITYSPAPTPSFSPLSFSGLIALVLLLLSIFGMLHYGLGVGRDINE